MQHINARLSMSPDFGWETELVGKTDILTLSNGDEFRNGDWAELKHLFTASFDHRRPADYLEVKRMFLVAGASLRAFRHRDELDWQADDEVFGTGDGVTEEFQLSKLSVLDGFEYVRRVFALPTAPAITADDAPITATVNLSTGKVLISPAPALGVVLRWTGPFETWVRFANDSLRGRLNRPNGAAVTVQLIEVPPPA